ncbi:MAG TPA: hypothetical protein VH165_32925 [Kofleriaceae bacterium]|nr:hypothetical protein [Kofleriaceae bacterium]
MKLELGCPRCKHARLPPLEVAACPSGCGLWVSAFASTEVLDEVERRADPITRWWRVREPCPICSEKMLLRGRDDAYFQGCDGHGFWIDTDTIQHTGLARGINQARLERKRSDEARMVAEREAREAAEHERDQRKHEKDAMEAGIEKALVDQGLAAKPIQLAQGWAENQVQMDQGLAAKPILLAKQLRQIIRGDPMALIQVIEQILGRIDALEVRNRQLEQRLAILERDHPPR